MDLKFENKHSISIFCPKTLKFVNYVLINNTLFIGIQQCGNMMIVQWQEGWPSGKTENQNGQNPSFSIN